MPSSNDQITGIFLGFYEKTMSDKVLLISFLAGPIHKLFKSGVYFAVKWILRFLGHQNLDFCMQMIGTWATGPVSWPIHILNQT